MRCKALRAKPGGAEAVIIFLVVQLLPAQPGVELGCYRIIRQALTGSLPAGPQPAGGDLDGEGLWRGGRR